MFGFLLFLSHELQKLLLPLTATLQRVAPFQYWILALLLALGMTLLDSALGE